jgi:hypothetical protein
MRLGQDALAPNYRCDSVVIADRQVRAGGAQ